MRINIPVVEPGARPAISGVPLLPGLAPGDAILIARLRSLGDIVLETPSIAAVHAWRPDLRICVLVEPRFAAVLEGNPTVAELIYSRELLATAATLRRRRFPIFFNQHGGPRSALLTAASAARWRVGWKGYQYSFVYNVRVPDKIEFYGTADRHTVEHRISQFYWTGLPRAPIPHAQVFPQPDAVDAVARWLAGKGIAPGSPYAVLQPNARSACMRWPVANFADLARWLRQRFGLVSIVNLGAADYAIAADVRRLLRDCAVLADSLDLRQLIALIAGAQLFVGNDSGPVHLAAAAARPCVVIYGCTNPVEWHPWQTEYRIVHTGAVFRSIRGDKSVVMSRRRTIQSIRIEEVRAACEQLLAAIAK